MTSSSKYVCSEQIDPKSKKQILVCSLKIGAQGAKSVSEPLKLVLEGKYWRERPWLEKFLDAVGLAAMAAVIVGVLYFAWPRSTPDLIAVSASVAPAEVVTGGASTLTFRFENKSRENLRDVRVKFDFPEHFLLAGIEAEGAEPKSAQEFDLGEIASTEYGVIHVRGTMFGDVGGEQVFTTTFTYTYGENGKSDVKVKEHIFSPTASTLALDLELPEHLVAYQEVVGSISYTNTGDVDFPDLTIVPTWPATFRLIESNPAMSDGRFEVSSVAAGESGIITFRGRLGTSDDSTFVFEPSFRFDETQYKQETLSDRIKILPSPLALRHSIEESALEPGGEMSVKLHYENVSQFTLNNIQFYLDTDAGILSIQKSPVGFAQKIDELAPGESGELSMTLPVRRTLSKSGLQSLENIKVGSASSAAFSFEIDGQTVEANTTGARAETPLTSPLALSSFARYWAPSGDQLGRGPVPPLVGETTKYWIFWNISGTTNRLANLRIEAELGPNVTLTGRQSVSVGNAITQSGGSVIWTINSIDPTLPPGSAVVGVAFEVALTPTAQQVGTAPTLLGPALATARDEFTGAVVSGSASAVTTLLSNDAKASELGGVVEL